MSGRCVFKFTADARGEFALVAAFKPVLFAEQFPADDYPKLWAEADTRSRDTTPTRFQIFGTGFPLPDGATHVASCVAKGGQLVWHLYQLDDSDEAQP